MHRWMIGGRASDNIADRDRPCSFCLRVTPFLVSDNFNFCELKNCCFAGGAMFMIIKVPS